MTGSGAWLLVFCTGPVCHFRSRPGPRTFTAPAPAPVQNSLLPCCAERRVANFIVGLTNTHPLAYKPVLWRYTLCAQYPGQVPAGATVSLHCDPTIKTSYRYVIVQLPKHEYFHVCELDVFARGMSKMRAVFLAEQLGNRR